MRKRTITLELVLALSTAGAACAQSSATGVTGGGLSELKVGDRVAIEPNSNAPDEDAPTSSNRTLVGLTGLAMVGTAMVFRLRRPRTI